MRIAGRPHAVLRDPGARNKIGLLQQTTADVCKASAEAPYGAGGAAPDHPEMPDNH